MGCAWKGGGIGRFGLLRNGTGVFERSLFRLGAGTDSTPAARLAETPGTDQDPHLQAVTSVAQSGGKDEQVKAAIESLKELAVGIPALSDLGDAEEIISVADQIILLGRGSQDKEAGASPANVASSLRVIVAKNARGVTGEITLALPR